MGPFVTIDSTNTYALNQGSEGLVVIADQQTAGRGRLGRSWHSIPGVGIWFTVCFDGLVQGLTFASALAVQEALASRCPAKIKWPNDILLDGRKVCGILVEHKNNRTAVGIGLNVHQTRVDFPEELREKAGSLESITGESWDRCEVLSDILIALDKKVRLLKQDKFTEILESWAKACEIVNRRIRTDTIEGIVKDIDEIGALIVQTDDGIERVLNGEIEYLNGDE
jgi:BirA family transcriptional regulator, biotin operon repressor / biotin---[acetyl-CoA-carboxylase] ligase